jgi:hypothetical protein
MHAFAPPFSPATTFTGANSHTGLLQAFLKFFRSKHGINKIADGRCGDDETKDRVNHVYRRHTASQPRARVNIAVEHCECDQRKHDERNFQHEVDCTPAGGERQPPIGSSVRTYVAGGQQQDGLAGGDIAELTHEL